MVDTLVRAKAVLAAFRLAKRRSGLPKTSLGSLFRCTLTPVSRSALSLLPVQPSLPPTVGEPALPGETSLSPRFRVQRTPTGQRGRLLPVASTRPVGSFPSADNHAHHNSARISIAPQQDRIAELTLTEGPMIRECRRVQRLCSAGE